MGSATVLIVMIILAAVQVVVARVSGRHNISQARQVSSESLAEVHILQQSTPLKYTVVRHRMQRDFFVAIIL